MKKFKEKWSTISSIGIALAGRPLKAFENTVSTLLFNKITHRALCLLFSTKARDCKFSILPSL